ncbi:TBC1 domain family member 2A-like [Uloborus diversus]|uniref:TBC1 domain family member 2A-like n=1 Tax=Uloborus diversus TaxID=327109 RepID=UPI00240A19B8|nr:TBC1 domain family member 2A-like [Uloborus diversus]
MTMSRGRSRSDSPTNIQTTISGPLVTLTDSFVSKKFERSVLLKALSRLKGRKRMWFVLDEGKCRLLYYKSECDARSKDPLGSIDIKGSAISLALDEDNQFVLHSSNGREHALVAEDHESMMLWVLALQARQDKTPNEPSVESNATPRRKQQQTMNNQQPHHPTSVSSLLSD